MAALDTSVEPRETECPVCHDDFFKPKILPCAHVICRDCLVTWLRSDPEAQCPICRCVIKDPKDINDRGLESLEAVAKALPTDLAMEALVESASILEKDHVCCVCDGVKAVSVCMNCGDMLCETCVTAHGKLSATQHHTVEKLVDLTAEKLAANRPVPCSSHPDEASKVYCSTHETPVCVLCATADHRACPDVTKVDTQAEKARATLANLAEKLSAGERDLERAMEELDNRLSQAEENEKTSVAQIEAAFLTLLASLEESCQQLRELAQQNKADVKTGVHDGKAILGGRRGKLRSHRRLVERSQHSTPSAFLHTVAEMLHGRVADFDFSTELPEKIRNCTMSCLSVDQEVLSRIERELQNLGSLKVTSTAPPRPPRAKPAQVLRFHSNHGKNIVLSNDQQTAEKQRDSENGNAIIVAAEKMAENLLYEIKVEEKGKRSGYVLWTGVTVRAPEKLTLPYSAGLWKDAIVISCDHVTEPDGNKNEMDVGKLLRNVPVGSRVGVMVDIDRCLHLYFDGKHQGVAARFLPPECFPFFDVFGPYKKVTAMPVTRVV